jgi:membrane-bound lytic murein transglycosylase D
MTLNKFLNTSKKYILSIGLFLLLFILIQYFSFFSTGTDDEKDNKDCFNTHIKKFGLNLPDKLDFAGENVPLNDSRVMENLARELLANTYWQSQSLLIFNRANRWFPVIAPILKQYGIPDDFKYLTLAESELTNLVSSAKATGYWQIIEETGKSYGLEINENVDERYSMEKSTEVACKYFREAYSQLKSWTLVAASYNMGIGGIGAQLNKQKVSNYYDLTLNEETSRYVFRILAFKEILSRPKAYGFNISNKDLYPPVAVKKMLIDSSINNLANFALAQGINYKILKLLNPWLRSSSLNNRGKKVYSVCLPAKVITDSSNFFLTCGFVSDSTNFLQ